MKAHATASGQSDLPGLTVEAARRLVATEGSVDRAAAVGGYPVKKFRDFCRAAGVKGKARGSWGITEEDKSGYAYAIRAVGFPMVKLGIAKDPWRRLIELQIGSFAPLRLELALWSDDALALESSWHKTHKSRRRIGEWHQIGEGESLTAVLLNPSKRRSP